MHFLNTILKVSHLLTLVNLVSIIRKGYYILGQEELKSLAFEERFILPLKTFLPLSNVQPKLFIFRYQKI